MLRLLSLGLVLGGGFVAVLAALRVGYRPSGPAGSRDAPPASVRFLRGLLLVQVVTYLLGAAVLALFVRWSERRWSPVPGPRLPWWVPAMAAAMVALAALGAVLARALRRGAGAGAYVAYQALSTLVTVGGVLIAARPNTGSVVLLVLEWVALCWPDTLAYLRATAPSRPLDLDPVGG